jgi:arginase
MLRKSKFVKNTISVIGAAWCEGQPEVGTQLAPAQLREAGLLKALRHTLGYSIDDVGDISIESLTKYNELMKAARPDFKSKNPEFYKTVGQLNEQLSKYVHLAAQQRNTTLVLGGDHSLGVGSIHGQLLQHGDDLRVIWVDAHADINTIETSPSGNYHGMPVAHLLGLIPHKTVTGFDWLHAKLRPENLVYIGLRDVDPDERRILREQGIKCYSIYDIDHLGGMRHVMDDAFAHLGLNRHERPLHVSFDIDACSSDYISGTGTAVRYGLSEREVIYMLRRIHDTGCLVHLDMAEINTLLDSPHGHFRDHSNNPYVMTESKTILHAIDFILYGLGQRDL